jgi:hypothetical protein
MRRTSAFGLVAFLSFLLLVWGIGVAHAHHDDDPDDSHPIHDFFDDLFDHGDDDGDGGDGGDGATCCACFNDNCCFLVDADKCTAEGDLGSASFFESFFGILGIEAANICSLCDQCAFGGGSTEGFLDVCSICIFDPLIQTHECTPVPPDVVGDIFGGACQLNVHGRSGGGAGGFMLIGIGLALGWLPWRLAGHRRMLKQRTS